MTTQYRRMQTEGYGISGGKWIEFTDDDLRAQHGARAVLGEYLRDGQVYVETWRNGDWRPASYRAVPMWERASTLEIDALETQAARLRRHAGQALAEQVDLLEIALGQVRQAEARAAEQRGRVTAAEERTKAEEKQAKAIATDAASKRKKLDGKLAVHDAASSPAPEPEPALA